MAIYNSYPIGQMFRVSWSFTSNGTPYDPPSVRIKQIFNNGASTTFTYGVDGQVVKDSVGNYHMDAIGTAAGTFTFRTEGNTPTDKAVPDYVIAILPSRFYP
jgi:hypothetical protein